MKQLATLLVSVFSLLLGLTSSAPAQTQIKLTTTQAGIYRVTTNQLANALGLSPVAAANLIANGNFTLLNQGQTNSWLPAADNSQLTFYAQAFNNNYTTNNVYWLVPGTNLPMAAVNGANPAAQTNEYYLCTRSFEVDSTNYARYDLVKNPETNYWFWAQVTAGGRFAHPFSYTNSSSFDAFGPTNIPSQFNARMMAVTATNQSFTLVLNGKTDIAWTVNWLESFGNNLLATPTNFTFSIPSTMLQANPLNTFTFQDSSASGLGSVWLLDSFTVKYPRQYVTTNGNLLCTANSNAVVTLQGFANGNITVLDVTQPQTPLLVNNLNVESASGSWRASLVPQQQNASYAACQLGSELNVAGLEVFTPVGLASGTNRGAFVIIAPTNFMGAAQPLANYRNAQGLETMVVSLESVYNEFDNGLREPKAISNFLAYAGQNWTVKPAYALLVGKGTYDYRNLAGCGDNLVPPLMIASIYGLVASDSQYGQIGNVAGPQISVGRFSVTNAVQVTNLIVKLKAYETNAPQARKALLLAEFSDSAGDFQSDMGAVQTVLAPSFSTTAILPSNTASNAATMRTNLLTGLNAGTDLLAYLGHGATVALGNELFFTNAEVAYLTSTRLPLISAMCCYIGKFNIPGAQCLSEALVLATNTGAIASLSATGESLNPDGTQLNLNLLTNFVSGFPGRLGDYVRQAMVSYNLRSSFTPSGMYNLIGDPSLQLDFTGVNVSGTVYADADGLWDGAVNGVGTDVNGLLFANLVASNNKVLATMAVTPAGLYSFAGVANGTYTVQISTNAGVIGQVMPVTALPGGWINTGEFVGTVNGNDGNANGLLAVTVSGANIGNANFGITQLASLSGQVIVDQNGNGVQDAGETNGLAGVTITLQNNAGTVAVTNTDGAGNFQFGSLVAGNYTVVQSVPSGYLNTTPTGLTVTLNSGLVLPGNNFLDEPLATVGDRVWLDLNRNGLQDPGEPGLAGVKVVLYQTNLLSQTITAVATNVSGWDGSYTFPNVTPGLYQVRFTPPIPDLTGSPASQGSNTNVDSDADPATGLTPFVPVTLGMSNLSVDAGFMPSLVTLNATVNSGQISVAWQTYAEGGLASFDLTRVPAGGTAQDVTPSLVAATGQGAGKAYTLPDTGATLPGAYTYHLYGLYTNGVSVELARTTISSFSQTPGTAAQLVFTTQPSSNTVVGLPFATQPVIHLRDVNGNDVTNGADATVSVTLTLSSGTGTLGGTTSVNAVAGVADFTGSGLNLNLTGSDKVLTATATVTAGTITTATSPAFTISPPASITGQVILDLNGNGLADVGETNGLSGVTITLVVNGVTEAVTNADANGNYSFDNLLPGNYTVTQTVPAGYLSTATNFIMVTLASGQSATGKNFFAAQPIMIGDYVWTDINGNGIQDVGEPSLAGAKIVLYQSNQVSGVVSALFTNVSGNLGYYAFTSLPPGIYQIGFTPPFGYLSTPALQGSNTNLDSNANATSGLTGFFALSSGQTNLSVDAGFKPNPTPVTLVSLSAQMYQGQAWVTWQTYDEYMLLGFDLTRSNADGTVVDVTPNLVWATGLDLGQTYTVLDAGVTRPGSYTYQLYAYNADGTIDDKGSTVLVVPDLTAVIAGRVILDVNGNGLADAGEANGLRAVTLTLQTNGVTLATTKTDIKGNYTFGSLPSGNYTVGLTLPAGYLSTAFTLQAVTLTSGQMATGKNFFAARPVTIGDLVWLDINKNGLQQNNEPGLPNVMVVLYQTNVVTHLVSAVATNWSSSLGIYTFTNLPPGIYQLGFTPPGDGYTASPYLRGNNTNVDSDLNPATGRTVFFYQSSGTTNLSMDAGFKPTPLAATLLTLSAHPEPGQISVTWQTYVEDGLLAFDLTRSTAGGEELDVTPDLVWATGLDLGQSYNVLDAEASLSAENTYHLYGLYTDGSSEELASVTVAATSVSANTQVLLASPVQILGLDLSGGTAVLRWTGGQPPYAVEQSASLGAAANWQSLATGQTATQLVVPLSGQAGFFRIRSGGN